MTESFLMNYSQKDLGVAPTRVLVCATHAIVCMQQQYSMHIEIVLHVSNSYYNKLECILYDEFSLEVS